jgi:hypothetical protein
MGEHQILQLFNDQWHGKWSDFHDQTGMHTLRVYQTNEQKMNGLNHWNMLVCMAF